VSYSFNISEAVNGYNAMAVRCRFLCHLVALSKYQ